MNRYEHVHGPGDDQWLIRRVSDRVVVAVLNGVNEQHAMVAVDAVTQAERHHHRD